MFRRRGQVGLIAITAIVTILVTVGVTYAVQNILATRPLAASAKILASGANLVVCPDASTNCTVVLSGPIDYGDMRAGVTGDYVVRIRNASTPLATGEAPASDLLVVDARLGYNSRTYGFRLMNQSCSTVREWFGTNPPTTGGGGMFSG